MPGADLAGRWRRECDQFDRSRKRSRNRCGLASKQRRAVNYRNDQSLCPANCQQRQCGDAIVLRGNRTVAMINRKLIAISLLLYGAFRLASLAVDPVGMETLQAGGADV